MLFACFCVLTCLSLGACAGPVEDPSTVPISAPDITPPDTTRFFGSVRVTIIAVNNQADHFYSLDGVNPSADLNDGHSHLYETPFYIYQDTTVKVVAVPKVPNRANSAVAERSYRVEVSKVKSPTSTLSPGTYRGRAIIHLQAPDELDARVQYVRDQDPFYVENSAWLDALPTTEIMFKRTGVHSLWARTILGQKIDDMTKISPPKLFKYVVSPPLAYDVSTECCNGKPTSMKPFTIWLQGVGDGAELKLSTTEQGCRANAHDLLGTRTLHTATFTTAYRFISTEDTATDVYVCLREVGMASFVAVPRRHELDKSFKLVPSSSKPIVGANGTIAAAENSQPPLPQGMTAEPTTRSPYGQPGGRNVFGESSGSISFMNVVIWVIILCGIGVAWKYFSR